MWRLGDLPKFFNWQQQKRDMNRKNKNITNSKPFANFKLSELIMRIGKKTYFLEPVFILTIPTYPTTWPSAGRVGFARGRVVGSHDLPPLLWGEHLPETRILGVSSKEDWYAQYLSKIRCSVSQGSCICWCLSADTTIHIGRLEPAHPIWWVAGSGRYCRPCRYGRARWYWGLTLAWSSKIVQLYYLQTVVIYV